MQYAIQSAAFSGTEITSFHLPASLETLGSPSLGTDFTTLTVDSNNLNFKAENNILYSKDGKNLLLYPPMSAQTEFEVPSGVEIIGESAFANYYIKTVVLPDTVKNVDIVEFDFVVGNNTIPQEIKTFTLGADDKVMLWRDMTNLVPLCEALIINDYQ